MDLEAFKPLNLAQLYQGADAAVAQSMQTNLLVMQAGRMKKEFDTEDALRDLAKNSMTNGPDGMPTMDLKAYARGAYAISPNHGMAIEKSMRESEKTALEMANTQSQVDERRLKMAADRLKHQNEASTVPFLKYKELTEKGVADPEARAQVQPLYQTAIQNLVSSGLFKPEELAKFNMAPEFDPTKAETGMRQVLGAKDALGEYWKGREFKASEGRDAEAKRHNTETERQARASLSQAQQHHVANLEAQGKEVKETDDGTWVVIDKKTKTSSPVLDPATNQPMKTSKSQGTEVERVASGFASRMREAEAILGTISSDLQKPGKVEAAGGVIPFAGEVIANQLRGDDRQKALQAQRDWVRSKLRKESGAAIGVDEMEKELLTYFPQIGDGKDVIKQKADARKTANEAMVQAAGKAYKVPAAKPEKDAPGKNDGTPVNITTADEYFKLADGTAYIDPKGVRRVKGQKASN